MKIIIAAASVLSLSLINASATPQDDQFQKIARDYIEQYLRANPEDATELGDHRFDGQLTDYSSDARPKDLATQKESLNKLNAFNGAHLPAPTNITFRTLNATIT